MNSRRHPEQSVGVLTWITTRPFAAAGNPERRQAGSAPVTVEPVPPGVYSVTFGLTQNVFAGW